jgi:hypothetical protein
MDMFMAVYDLSTFMCCCLQVKLNAKQEKKYRNRLTASGTATSGLSSTLAFTPVQVRGKWPSINQAQLLMGLGVGRGAVVGGQGGGWWRAQHQAQPPAGSAALWLLLQCR